MKKRLKHNRKYGGSCFNAPTNESTYLVKRLKMAHRDGLWADSFQSRYDNIPEYVLKEFRRWILSMKKTLKDNKFTSCCFACWCIDHWEECDNYPECIVDVHCFHCLGDSSSPNYDESQKIAIDEHRKHHNLGGKKKRKRSLGKETVEGPSDASVFAPIEDELRKAGLL